VASVSRRKERFAVMEWYWWALIGVGLVALAYVKIAVMKKIVDAQKAKKAVQAALEDE
jgi:hypothetical protein